MTTRSSESYRVGEAPLAVDTPYPSDAELSAFASLDGASYYLPTWRGFRDGAGPFTTPNLAALLLSSGWCFWRRMPGQGVALWAGIQLLQQLAGFALVQLMQDDPSSGLRSFVASLTLLLCSGVWSVLANRVYYGCALRAIAAAHRATSDPEARLEQIRRAGGTSGWTIGLGLVLGIVASIAVSIALEIALRVTFGVGLPRG